MITQQELKERLSYDAETGLFRWLTQTIRKDLIGKVAGNLSCQGYIEIKLNQKLCKAHRLAWLYQYGEIPALEIDHINCIRTDNRISNLRLATRQQNKINSGIGQRNTSGYKGVSWNKVANKWHASARINGKNYRLGNFTDIKDASNAYLTFVREHHGEFLHTGYHHDQP